jgi:hypothetical protein
MNDCGARFAAFPACQPSAHVCLASGASMSKPEGRCTDSNRITIEQALRCRRRAERERREDCREETG